MATEGITVAFTISVLLPDFGPHDPPDVVKVNVTDAGADADAV